MKKTSAAVILIALCAGVATSARAADTAPPFSDKTKAALIEGCKTDLPKKYGTPDQKIDPAKFSTVIDSACFCVFTYTQQFGNELSKDQLLNDKDYQMLARLLQKGALTSRDVPDADKKATLESIGTSYPKIIEKQPVQSCLEQTVKAK